MANFGSQVNAGLGAINYAPYAQGANAGAEAQGRGLASLGQSIGQGIQQYQQNKLLAGQAIGKFEAAMNQYGPELLKAVSRSPDMAKSVERLTKDGNLKLKDAAQLAIFADTFGVAKQREADQQMKQKALQIDAYNAESNRIRAMNDGVGQPTSAMRDADMIIYSELASGQLKPDGVDARRAELIRQGGRDQERFDNAGTYVLRDGGGGAITGVKDRKTGQIGSVDKNGKFVPLDTDKYMPSTTSDANPYMNEEAFNKMAQEVVLQENSVKALNKFMAGVKDLPSGVDKLSTKISSAAKTIMGEKLSPEELQLGEARARQQRLLGALRTSILGPGTLTEIDAQRILEAVGGDVASVTTNPEVMKSVLTDIMQEKLESYGQLLEVYNAHVAGRYGRAGYKQRQRVEPKFDTEAAAPALIWDPATKRFKRQ